MSDRPDIEEPVNDPADGKAAAAVARIYFYLFFVFCGVIAYLEKPALGLWLVAVLVVGPFGVPLLIAAPLMYLKKVLAAKGLLRPLNKEGTIHYRLIDLAGAVVLWYATWGTISFLSG